MDYLLSYIIFDKEKNAQRFETIKVFPDNEYKVFKKHKKILNNSKDIVYLFDIVKDNFIEFNKSLEPILREYMKNTKGAFQNRQEESDKASLIINRHFLNFLSSIRTYLDHLETSFKRNHKHDPTKIDAFKTIVSNIYDENFTYRFIYKLRNYAQHCGLPIEKINYEINFDNTNGNVPHAKMDMYFDRDVLLNKYNGWGSQVKADLEASEKRIELGEVVNTIMDLMLQLSIRVSQIDSENTRVAANYFLKLIEGYEDKDSLCVLKYIEKPERKEGIQKMNLHIEHIPVELSKIALGM